MTEPSRAITLLDGAGGRWERSKFKPSTWDYTPVDPSDAAFRQWTREDIEALWPPTVEVDEPAKEAA